MLLGCRGLLGVAVGWRLQAVPMVGVFGFAAVCLAVPMDGFFGFAAVCSSVLMDSFYGFAAVLLAVLNSKPAKMAAEVVRLTWLGCGGKTGRDGCR